MQVIEAVIIVAQIFADSGSYAAQDYNVYVLASSLAWTVMTASTLQSENHKWYPYWGSWILTLAAEVTISVLSLLLDRPASLFEWMQVVLQSVRIVGFASLILAYLGLTRREESFSDEETAPLLPRSEASAETMAPASASKSYSTGDFDEAEIDSAADADVAKRDKEVKEQLAKLQTRVQEEGNWFNYIRGYSVSSQPSAYVLPNCSLSAALTCINRFFSHTYGPPRNLDFYSTWSVSQFAFS